jgi:hypothetical protein
LIPVVTSELPVDHTEREKAEDTPNEYDSGLADPCRGDDKLTGDGARNRALLALRGREKRELDVGECVADAAGEEWNT